MSEGAIYSRGGIRKTLKNVGTAVTKCLASVGGLIAGHSSIPGYAILLVVCAFFPWLTVFLLGCFLCYAYWESGKP